MHYSCNWQMAVFKICTRPTSEESLYRNTHQWVTLQAYYVTSECAIWSTKHMSIQIALFDNKIWRRKNMQFGYSCKVLDRNAMPMPISWIGQQQQLDVFTSNQHQYVQFRCQLWIDWYLALFTIHYYRWAFPSLSIVCDTKHMQSDSIKTYHRVFLRGPSARPSHLYSFKIAAAVSSQKKMQSDKLIKKDDPDLRLYCECLMLKGGWAWKVFLEKRCQAGWQEGATGVFDSTSSTDAKVVLWRTLRKWKWSERI